MAVMSISSLPDSSRVRAEEPRLHLPSHPSWHARLASQASMGQSKNVMVDFMKKNKPSGTSFQDGMLKLVRTLPKVLKYLPGDKAKDARSFMMSLQYWLGGSPENIEALLLNLASNYVPEVMEKGMLNEVSAQQPSRHVATPLCHPYRSFASLCRTSHPRYHSSLHNHHCCSDRPLSILPLQPSWPGNRLCFVVSTQAAESRSQLAVTSACALSSPPRRCVCASR
eukprot:2169871-Pleurochrysis_carterae.AAC.1